MKPWLIGLSATSPGTSAMHMERPSRENPLPHEQRWVALWTAYFPMQHGDLGHGFWPHVHNGVTRGVVLLAVAVLVVLVVWLSWGGPIEWVALLAAVLLGELWYSTVQTRKLLRACAALRAELAGSSELVEESRRAWKNALAGPLPRGATGRFYQADPVSQWFTLLIAFLAVMWLFLPGLTRAAASSLGLRLPYYGILLLFVVLPPLVPYARLVLARRKASRLLAEQRCLSCGYDASTSAALCPECGDPHPLVPLPVASRQA